MSTGCVLWGCSQYWNVVNLHGGLTFCHYKDTLCWNALSSSFFVFSFSMTLPFLCMNCSLCRIVFNHDDCSMRTFFPQLAQRGAERHDSSSVSFRGLVGTESHGSSLLAMWLLCTAQFYWISSAQLTVASLNIPLIICWDVCSEN